MRDGFSRVEDESDLDIDLEYGSPALVGLLLATVFLSLLPIPVVALELLPAYTMHARFLIFYAPLVCFLVLGYLLYVREVLAPMMFGPREEMPEPDPYYPQPLAVRGRILARRLLAGVFTLLPAILLAASFYCVSRYVDRFNDSVAIASGVLAGRIPPPVPVDSAATDTRGASAKGSVGSQPAAGIPGTALDPSPEIAALRRLPGLATDPDPLRTYTLRAAMIDDIPYFAELTAFYIGGIVCALAAVLLVLLKEYARGAMRVSEGKVPGGRMANEPLTPDLESVGSRRRG